MTALALLTAGLFLPFEAPRSAKAPASTPISESSNKNLALLLEKKAQTAPLRLAPLRPALPARIVNTRLVVGNGDTLSTLLEEQGIAAAQAEEVVEATRKEFDLRKLRSGQELDMRIDRSPKDPLAAQLEKAVVELETAPRTADGRPSLATADIESLPALPGPRLLSLSFDSTPTESVKVRRQEDGSYLAGLEEKHLTTEMVRAKGRIRSSFYTAAQNAGVPVQTILQLIKMYSFKVDFQREIAPGDSFEVYFSKRVDDRGKTIDHGDVLFAELTVGSNRYELWRFTLDDQVTDYFDQDGRSMRTFLMRTPIDGARISSGFGMRKHPILGYSRLHGGVDFAAPTGTPVYASGDGTVQRAGRFGSFGNYVAIRHRYGYETAYAHLNRVAPGLKTGDRVSQGDVIGYVGTTGRSTGPHLHYEVHLEGKKLNPMSVDVPTGLTLRGRDLKRFKAMKTDLGTEIAAIPTTDEERKTASIAENSKTVATR